MNGTVSIACIQCNTTYPSDTWQQECRCGGSLTVAYEMHTAPAKLVKSDVENRPNNIWRYREVLPLPPSVEPITLGEGGTPVVPVKKIGDSLGLPLLFIKDEGRNPTGTFKDRGAAVGISVARSCGVQDIVVPTMGSAGAAWAAYGAAAGIRVHVSMPSGLPPSFAASCRMYGANVDIFDGDFAIEAARRHEHAIQKGWASATTLREPYRLEGKKTLLYEMAEHWGWRVPDVVLCPTGGGVQVLAIWKAYQELLSLRWIDDKPLRLVAVQASGVAPIVRAWESRQLTVEAWPKITTRIPGFMVSKPRAGPRVLEVLRQSKGEAIAIEDEAMINMASLIAKQEGLAVSPEGAAAVVAAGELRKRGAIQEGETVVAINTATALRYLDL